MRDDVVTAGYIAETARETFEPLWVGWKRACGHPDPERPPASLDACIPSSIALCEIMNRVLYHDGWRFRVTGGRPTKKTPQGGFWMNGRGGTHAWVAGWDVRHRRRMVIDITADQYGGSAVYCEPTSAYHVANYSHSTIKMFYQRERLNAELWTMALVFALQEPPFHR
jgi:hypothetical protein